MRVLYAIQATGNGHVSRARDIVPILLDQSIELDLLLSGRQADMDLPYPIKYRYKGLSFTFGKRGGIDFFSTFKHFSITKLIQEFKDFSVKDYDLIISDFEPISAWKAKWFGVPCVGMSHQSAVLANGVPLPKRSFSGILGKMILKYYAPTDHQYGFHFKKYNKNIFTPVIRKEVRELEPTNKGYYTVYLPAFSDTLLCAVLSHFPKVEWQVFSKHNTHEVKTKNIHIQPVNNEAFLNSLTHCKGVLCGAGFETPAEALFLKKKLMVIPMKGQFEQQCNAEVLREMGVPVIPTLHQKYIYHIQEWLTSNQYIEISFPDETSEIIQAILQRHLFGKKEV